MGWADFKQLKAYQSCLSTHIASALLGLLTPTLKPLKLQLKKQKRLVKTLAKMRLGKIGEKTAKFISDVRELVDGYKNVYVKSMNVEASIKDINDDQKANELGRRTGRRNPQGEMEDFLDRSNLPGIDEEY